jgi:large subunit ribosomal protein L10
MPALKAAYAEEGFYVGADQLEALTAIKSKDEVIAEIVALLQSPAKNVLSALQSGGNTIHGVLKTLGERPE